MEELFRRMSERISMLAGTSWCFISAVVLIVVWAATGPVFGYSNTWQLVVNTGTTIVTFLMVFLIQNTQNREAIAVQLKLDELLRAVHGARTGMINVELLSDAELNRLRKELEQVGREGSDLTSVEATVTSRATHRRRGSGQAAETSADRQVEVSVARKKRKSSGRDARE